MDCLSILSISSIFLKYKVAKSVPSSIFICVHYPLSGVPTYNNSSWKLFRTDLNLSNVSISMTLCTFLKTPSPKPVNNMDILSLLQKIKLND